MEVKISVKDVESGIWKIANWNALGLDGVRDFGLKVDEGVDTTEKDCAKGTMESNYRPVMFATDVEATHWDLGGEVAWKFAG